MRSTRPTLPPSEPSPSPWPSRSRPHSCPQQSSRRALGWRLGGQRVPRELPPLDGQILDARGLVSVPFITARMATEPKPNPPLDSRAGRYALEGVPPSVVRADAWVSDPSDLTHSDSLSLDFAQGRLVGLVGSSSTFLPAPGFIEQAGPFSPWTGRMRRTFALSGVRGVGPSSRCFPSHRRPRGSGAQVSCPPLVGTPGEVGVARRSGQRLARKRPQRDRPLGRRPEGPGSRS